MGSCLFSSFFFPFFFPKRNWGILSSFKAAVYMLLRLKVFCYNLKTKKETFFVSCRRTRSIPMRARRSGTANVKQIALPTLPLRVLVLTRQTNASLPLIVTLMRTHPVRRVLLVEPLVCSFLVLVDSLLVFRIRGSKRSLLLFIAILI